LAAISRTLEQLAPGETVACDGLAATAGPASILQTLNRINKRLECLLMELPNDGSADAALRQLAQELIAAVARDPDIALACIFLGQIAGRYAVRHCVETTIVAALLARAMRKSQAEVLSLAAAALTMNVGMLRQIERFQSKDHALSSEERAIVRRHPTESAVMLMRAGVSDPEWIDYVLLHHENEDGSGYPEGRVGGGIPQNAKLIGLADRYCAFVSARNYRRSVLPNIALSKLCIEAQLPVDSAIARQFVEHIGHYPPGTLVRLRNGQTGVVSRRADASGALSVHALLSADGKALPKPQLHGSTDADCAIDEALHEDHVALRFSMKQVWGELASL
jgi:hypothetical protein